MGKVPKTAEGQRGWSRGHSGGGGGGGQAKGQQNVPHEELGP